MTLASIFYIAFAVTLLAASFFKSLAVRVSISFAMIVVVGYLSFIRGLNQFYERGSIATSVVELARRTNEEERDRLVEAAEEFRSSFRRTDQLTSTAGGELLNAIRNSQAPETRKANKAEMATPRKPSD